MSSEQDKLLAEYRVAAQRNVGRMLELESELAAARKEIERYSVELSLARQEIEQLKLLYNNGNTEIERLKEALRKIANPIEFMRKDAEAQGMKLLGSMAVALSEDAGYLKGIATEALAEKKQAK